MTLIPTVVLARCLYAYENDALQTISVEARALYEYENDGIQALTILARCLYDDEATRDLPIFPWLDHIDPVQQYPLGQVSLYGDGLGQFQEVGAGSTITASSTNDGHIPGNVAARTTDYWLSNDGATAWLRFTFGAPTKLYGIALADVIGGGWGTPLFRFSSGADVIATPAAPIPSTLYQTSEYPVGLVRTLYILPTARTVTWVEVRVSSGGGGGLSQAWVYADLGVSAEPSTVDLNGEPSGTPGIWLNRSPNLWPANSGVPLTAAGTMTVPSDGTSGLVIATEP